MTAKRNWSNFAVILLAVLLLVTIWQIFYSQTTIPDIPQYSKSAYSLYTNCTGYTYHTHTLGDTDYYRLIDLNFTFDTQNYACNDTSPLALIMIHSSPANFEKRKTIRETWGSYKGDVKVLFAMGRVRKNATLERLLIEENSNYSDLMQGSFADSYKNLTYKHVMLFKYAIYHCPEAKYIIKTDDDVFVNMPAMMNFLTRDLSQYGAENLLFCMTKTNTPVIRSYRSKWRVSFKEYPDKTYPTNCPGWFLLYSQNVVFELYKLAQKSRYFWIDDVHLTGTLFEKLHMVHTDARRYMLTRDEIERIKDGENFTRPFLIGSPNMIQNEIRLLQSLVEANSVPKTVINAV